MAFQSIEAEYAADAQDVILELRENGHELSFGNKQDSADPWGPVEQYTEVGRANVLPIDWMVDQSDDVLEDDILLMVSNEVDLDACTHFVNDRGQYNFGAVSIKENAEFCLYKINPYKFDNNTLIFYFVQARR